MEEGSLFKQVKMVGKFSEEEAASKLWEVCEAVRYLHTRDILHRDIKPENIVLSNVGNAVCRVYANYATSAGQHTARNAEPHTVALSTTFAHKSLREKAMIALWISGPSEC